MSSKTFTVEQISKVLNDIREQYTGEDMPVAYIIAEIEGDLDIL